MANKRKARKSSRRKNKKTIDFRYIIAGVFLIILLAVGVILNNFHNTDNVARVVNNLDIDNGDLKINWSRYSTFNIKLIDTFEISQAGIYHLTGELDDGYISVNVSKDDPVKLILDNVTITNTKGPAILCAQADDLVIEVVGENHLSDGEYYGTDFEENIDAVIYSKADTTFQGEGTLYIDGAYQDGIVSKDDLKFVSGTYYITAFDDGVHGKDSVYIVNGDINIEARGDGVKSNNETDAGKGFVKIEGGEIVVSASDDGIHAYNNLVVDDGTIDILKSYEGLEARNIVVNNGEIKLLASDDGINAGGGTSSTTNNNRGAMSVDTNCIISINGGNIYVNAAGDGIDSNGYLYFNGGKVVVDGPTNNGNGSLDAGAGIIMTGGEVIAAGASGMAETLGQNSSVFSISVFFDSMQSKDTLIEIVNSANETVMSHTSAKTFSHIAAGSSKFNLGETYTLYINNEKYQEFTISEVVTTVGDGWYRIPNTANGNEMPNERMMPGMPDERNMQEAPGGQMMPRTQDEQSTTETLPNGQDGQNMPNTMHKQ